MIKKSDKIILILKISQLDNMVDMPRLEKDNKIKIMNYIDILIKNYNSLQISYNDDVRDLLLTKLDLLYEEKIITKNELKLLLLKMKIKCRYTQFVLSDNCCSII